jgi:hypothetical protein
MNIRAQIHKCNSSSMNVTNTIEQDIFQTCRTRYLLSNLILLYVIYSALRNNNSLPVIKLDKKAIIILFYN